MSETEAPEPAAPATPSSPHPETRPRVDAAVEAAIRIGLIGGLLLLCFRIVEPFLVPIAWGIILAVAVWPAYAWLLERLGGRRIMAAVVFVIVALLVLLVPVAMLSETLVQGAEWLAHGFESGDLKIPPPPDLSRVPLLGAEVEDLWRQASTNIQDALRALAPQLQSVGSWLLRLAASAGVGLLHFVLAILIAGLLLAKSQTGRRAADAIGWRLAGERGLRFARLSEAVVRSVSRGILGVALIQALLAGIGMLAAGVPAAGLWALVVLLLATIQIGAFPVLLPVMIYLFYSADLTTAVLFAVWSLLVGSIDNVLKPILLGRGVSVPLAVIFIGAIGGFIGAGIIGLFVGAVVLVLGYELFLAWLDEAVPPGTEAAPNGAAPLSTGAPGQGIAGNTRGGQREKTG
jgi:predicted PurR-regulated permease PerM